jgi:hypothetical protein
MNDVSIQEKILWHTEKNQIQNKTQKIKKLLFVYTTGPT